MIEGCGLILKKKKGQSITGPSLDEQTWLPERRSESPCRPWVTSTMSKEFWEHRARKLVCQIQAAGRDRTEHSFETGEVGSESLLLPYSEFLPFFSFFLSLSAPPPPPTLPPTPRPSVLLVDKP